MFFQVTDIKFDFEDAQGVLSEREQEWVIYETCRDTWVADDEDDLVDLITGYTGWCIKSIQFETV